MTVTNFNESKKKYYYFILGCLHGSIFVLLIEKSRTLIKLSKKKLYFIQRILYPDF